MHTEAHLFSVPNYCLWYDKLWGPSQRVVTLLLLYCYCPDDVNNDKGLGRPGSYMGDTATDSVKGRGASSQNGIRD